MSPWKSLRTLLLWIMLLPTVTLSSSLPVWANTYPPNYPIPRPHNSALWGAQGELWDARGRLPDFSFAGYRGGGVALPNVPTVKNVKTDFGALGDGVTDDSAAFRRALVGTNNGALYIPPGRYILSSQLKITKSNLVLRGAGSGKFGPADPATQTILHFKKGLLQLLGPGHWGYADDGLLAIGGATHKSAVGARITNIEVEAQRGDTQLIVRNAATIQVGEFVILSLSDDASFTFWHYLHNNQARLPAQQTWPLTPDYWPVQVIAKHENTLTLAQPLRFDVRRSWKPTLHRYNPVQEIGIENLRITFDELPMRSHRNGHAGYNAIAARGQLNSWYNDITVENADNGITLGAQSKFNTLSNIWFKGRSENLSFYDTPGNDVDPGAGSVVSYYKCFVGAHITGHHGFLITIRSHDNLVTDFEFNSTWAHDIGVMHLSSGNVFRNGRGPLQFYLPLIDR